MAQITGKWNREWLIVAACFILTFSAGPYFTLTVFFSSFEADFGWSRALISSVHSALLVTGSASSILFGWLADRYGPRLTILISGLPYVLSIALCSQIQNIGQFIVLYAISSAGTGAALVVPMVTVQRLISEKKRGLALGLTTAGMPICRLAFVPIAGILISALGWRTSYIVFGVVVAVLILIATMLIPSRREREVLERQSILAGDRDIKSTGQEVNGGDSQRSVGTRPLLEIMKTKTFILSAIMYIFPLVAVHMIMVHIVPFAVGVGIDKVAAATAAGLIGAFGIAGNLIFPSLSVKISWRWLVCITALGYGLAMLWLMGTSSLWMLYIFVIFFGFFSHGASPARFGLLRYLFGTKSLGSIMGILTAVSTLFGALGPLVAGYIYDQTGSYSIAFLIAAVSLFIMAFIALLLKHPVYDS
ncbi:MFS transporter [Chloroflexota bacterium]